MRQNKEASVKNRNAIFLMDQFTIRFSGVQLSDSHVLLYDMTNTCMIWQTRVHASPPVHPHPTSLYLTHTCTCTHTHTWSWTHTHRHLHTHIHEHTHTWTHTCTHSVSHTHKHTHTHKHNILGLCLLEVLSQVPQHLKSNTPKKRQSEADNSWKERWSVSVTKRLTCFWPVPAWSNSVLQGRPAGLPESVRKQHAATAQLLLLFIEGLYL